MFISHCSELTSTVFTTASRLVLSLLASASKRLHPESCRPFANLGDSQRRTSRLIKPRGLAFACQLVFCHLFYEVDGASTCNPVGNTPVEPTRPQIKTLFHSNTCRYCLRSNCTQIKKRTTRTHEFNNGLVASKTF